PRTPEGWRPRIRQRGGGPVYARGVEEANEQAGVLEDARGRRGGLWPGGLRSPAYLPRAGGSLAGLVARRPQPPSPNPTHILWAANPARSWGLGRSLVLNATDEPLCVVPSRRAVVLVLKAKAEIVSANGEAYHSEKLRLPVPSVVRLTY